MNEFDQRWKEGADAARSGEPPLPEAAPFGFATRVVEQWRATPEPSPTVLWQALALRALGSVTLALLILLACGEMSEGDGLLARPEFESVVPDSLSFP